MGFDLVKNDLSAKAEKGYEFELESPDAPGEPTGAFITVRGTESKIVRDYQRKKFNQLQAKQKLDKKRGKDPEDFDLDDLEEQYVEKVLNFLVNWKGISEDGKDLPYTKENAERILTAHPWIREQIVKAAEDITNFRDN